MKKLLVSLGLLSILGGFISFASATTSCEKEVNFTNTNACVDIQYVSTNTRRLVTTVDEDSTSNLKCDIMTPDSALKSITACNGEFTYNQSIAGRIKLRIRYNDAAPTNWEDKPSSSNVWTYPQWIFNFANRDRFTDITNNTTNTTTDTDNFYLTTDDTTPTTSQYIDLTVKARDGSYTDTSYRGKINFEVYYKATNSSTRVRTTSSNYYTMSSNYGTYGYTFTSSNNGIKTFTDFIKFNQNNYSYKIVVYDDDNESIYKEMIFTVGTTTNTTNTDTDNFYLTTDDTTPTTSQYVDLTVKAKDGSVTDTSYRGKINFEVYYKATNSSTRVRTTSSNYYTMSSNYGTYGYTFTSSNNGIKTFTDFIKFNQNNYSYKIVVYDDDNESIYKEMIFTVGTTTNTTNTDTDNFYLTTDDTTPTTSQYVDLTVKAKDGSVTDTSYRGKINFEVYYKATNSSTRVRTTSSNYYTMSSNYGTYGYTFTSSNNGEKTFTDFIKFNQNNYSYKVVVYDENNESIEGYRIFTVGSNVNNNTNTDNFYLSTNDSHPTTYERIHLGIRARDGSITDTSYRGTVNFKMYYKASGSSTWMQTTSDTYLKMNSNYSNGFTFTPAKNGYAYMVNLVRFHKNNYSYKVVVYDEDNNIETEKIFTVGHVN